MYQPGTLRSFKLQTTQWGAGLINQPIDIPKHVPYLDGWRGLAILLVLCEHFIGSGSFELGEMGVDTFFVLSGMLMSNILFVKRSSLGNFYKRRISRIFPALLTFLFVVYLTDFAITRHFDWREALSTASFIRTYYPSSPALWDLPLPLGHLWSLNIEEHAYILMSLITTILLVRKREWLVLVSLGLLSIFIYLAYYHFPSIAPHNFELRTEAKASFIMMSAGYFLIKGRLARYVNPWHVLIASASVAFCYITGEGAWRYILAPMLLAFIVNHLAQSPDLMRRILTWKPLRKLGTWSYSIYLWQQPFYQYKRHHHLGSTIVLLAVLTGISSFYLIEDPMRAWLNSKWK
ncbi:MAG: acyltransferase family protein [Blastocatellia bacterium]